MKAANEGFIPNPVQKLPDSQKHTAAQGYHFESNLLDSDLGLAARVFQLTPTGLVECFRVGSQ